jgi:hypothetical protein
MKLPILILSLFACIATANAQNPRTETIKNGRVETYSYQKGGDSIRYTILGTNDTAQQTDYYRNGQVQRKRWRDDSIYRFDFLGRLDIINYDVHNLYNHPKNYRSFHDNGRLSTLNTYKDGVELEQEFAENGRLLLTNHKIDAVGYAHERSEDRNGVPIASRRIDTLINGKATEVVRHDTLYFENGRVSYINDMGVSKTFDSTGLLIKTTQRDSLELREFKDNVECYYGLKNERGDTIVKARFDQIEHENDFMLAFNGKKAIMLQLNGAPMSNNFKALTEVETAYRFPEFSKEDFNTEFIDKMKRKGEVKATDADYIFVDDSKYGLMTSKADILMPAQDFTLTGRYVGDKKYFEFLERDSVTVGRTGFINLKGKPLFPDNIKGVVYSYFEDYFFLCSTPYQRQSSCGNSQGEWMRHRTLSTSSFEFLNGNLVRQSAKNLGFGKADGTIILEPKYEQVTHIDSCLLMVEITKNIIDAYHYDKRNGIYNFRTKKWLLDTTDFQIKDFEYTYKPYFIIYHVPTKKYGIIDSKGGYILPLVYDDINDASILTNFVMLKKGKTTQIASIVGDKITIQKEKYDFLKPLVHQIKDLNSDNRLAWFIAKQNNKWGLIDVKGKTLKPFVYDYAATTDSYDPKFLVVKDNQAAYYGLESFPNEMADFPNFVSKYPKPNEVKDFNLLGSTETVFFINPTGKVVIPPQYKRLSSSSRGDLVFLEDAKKQKKFVFPSTGKLVDFPFNYSIDWADVKSSLMIVNDTTSVSHGVVSTDGKQLMACKNYCVALGDIESNTFFVKTDTPLIERTKNYYGGFETVLLNMDSLSIDDQNWMMYDKNGALISDKPFRFAIEFRQGVGIGMKGDDFSLYRTDGTKLTVGGVQNFNNIRLGIGRKEAFYVLFYNQGMTPQLVLTHSDGSILVESGRYDGISRFYGKYALVSKAGKIGLIDSLGKEVFAPQDLMTSTAAFMDSLSMVNEKINEKRRKKKDYNYYDLEKLPVSFIDTDAESNPDSMAISPPQRATLLNAMLQKMQPLVIQTASDLQIERAKIRRGEDFISNYYASESVNYGKAERVVVADKTMAFVLVEDRSKHQERTIFYNFYSKNNRWNELQINDLLNIQGEKRWLMNDFITKKVKAMKDQQIDCSNASAFITTVENRWQLTKDGVDFCFDATGYRHDFAVISFTWAELSPFLKLRIY